VYHVRDRGTATMPATPHADDGSIQVHACHGPMREIEVLHDQLLALFDRHPDLEPSDVVVMIPDVERYAPCIEAIFGTAPPERAIPYTIADRSLRAERPLARAFLELLALPASRYDANRLLALLDVDAVRRRFGFGEAEVASVRRWVREAGVRWGVDAAARGALAKLGVDVVSVGNAERFDYSESILVARERGTDVRLLGEMIRCRHVVDQLDKSAAADASLILGADYRSLALGWAE
jgi:GNAT superfamily N-acetyltransferase